MNTKKIINIVVMSIFTLVVITVVYFFFDNLVFELIGGFCGFVLGYIFTSILNKFSDKYNDKNKLISADYNYDKQKYLKKVRLGDCHTTIWYDALVTDPNMEYTVNDDAEKLFTLDTLIQTNYASIIRAHNDSFTANPMMVRLDNATANETTCLLETSRTAFFNDLVTNRSMDYEFSDGLTIRNIYESNRFITPLAVSKLSNHIGINVLIFQGDSMILLHRGAHGTTSKNNYTSGLAFGVSEDDWRKATATIGCKNDCAKQYDGNRLLDEIILCKMSKEYSLDKTVVDQAYGSGRIKIYNLGLGRVLFMGGKPQFYFALIVDKDFVLLKKNENTNRNQIDFNKDRLAVNSMKLVHDGKNTLAVTRSDGKRVLHNSAAETSFFVNYWHLLVAPQIEGVPHWVYDTASVE